MPSAIVTASDSGIGKATAVALAARGLDVGVTWHEDEAGAKETRARWSRRTSRGGSSARPDGAARAAVVIDGLAGALGGVDVFVNNAGAGSRTLRSR